MRTVLWTFLAMVLLGTAVLMFGPKMRQTEATRKGAAPQTPTPITVAVPIQQAKEVARDVWRLLDSKAEWKTPIAFYGKVLDENGLPVPATRVLFRWTDLSAGGTSEKSVVSDANGLFELRGATGKHLSVYVTNQGYYAYSTNEISFFYAGENVNFVADPARPVTFRLKKKGDSEALVYREFPGAAKRFRLTNDLPVEFDLFNGKLASTGEGHMQLKLWISDQEAARQGRGFDWKFFASVPKGGLVESTNHFDFIAPVNGYSSNYEVAILGSSDSGWTGNLEKHFFLRLDSGFYGRIAVRLLANNGILRFESFINPSGSRNLEYDPAISSPKPFYE